MTCRVFRGIALASYSAQEGDNEGGTELDQFTSARMPVFTSIGDLSASEMEAKTQFEIEEQEIQRESMNPDARLTNHKRNRSIQEGTIPVDAV